MSFTNVYIGDTENLSLLEGDDVISFTFTVTNSDASAYSFSGVSDQNMYIYSDKYTDTLLVTIPAAQLVIASNVITWTSDYSADIALDTGAYYYVLTWEDATSRPITIALGDFKIV